MNYYTYTGEDTRAVNGVGEVIPGQVIEAEIEIHNNDFKKATEKEYKEYTKQK